MLSNWTKTGASLIEIRCPLASDSEALGERLGRLIPEGAVIALDGALGAGKTTFTKGLARGMGIDAEVTSPSYTIIDEYQGRLPLYHMDAYRLSGSEDFIGTGGEEYFYGKGVSVIEWSERIADILPPETWHIHITEEADGTRCFTLEGEGIEELMK